MTETQNISNAFPLPPDHYKYFTDENLDILESLKGEQKEIEKKDVFRFLEPPLPPEDEKFTVFGRVFPLKNINPELKDQGVEKLFDSDNDASVELRKLTFLVVKEYMGLLKTLSTEPKNAIRRTYRQNADTVCKHGLLGYRDVEADSKTANIFM
ncbi:hypothetical protein BB558_000998 [Smittium angustum]|uniref:Mediator of RNA polymerase II transcription subunit 7 n=1 Tax=Smittium angustum TaxID=133377 RepID=A0A2U1JCL6_SMIAN|nr:hypothetical protein BB558_000998 [Smittium angustum]